MENDSLIYAIASNPANGTVTITSSSSGTYTYSPVANYNGSDSFMFTASDSSLSDTATITINVLTIDDLPVVVNALVDITVNEDAQDTVVADLDMVFMDVDEELEYSHIIEDTALVFASVTNDSVTLQFLPDANGTTNIIFTATNPTIRASVNDTMTVIIVSVNDPPVIDTSIVDPIVMDEDDELPLLSIDDLFDYGIVSDIDNTLEELSFNLFTDNENIQVVWDSTSASNPMLVPDSNYYGEGTLTLCVSDGEYEVCGVNSITINAVNDAPESFMLDTLDAVIILSLIHISEPTRPY